MYYILGSKKMKKLLHLTCLPYKRPFSLLPFLSSEFLAFFFYLLLTPQQ